MSLPDSTHGTIDLTAETFEQATTAEGIVLVDFWAGWCGPCRSFAPVYDAAAEQHRDISFGKVDTEAEQKLAGRIGIRSIPTLMAFRDGILMHAQPGALPAPALEQLITTVRDVDMDEVRRQLAAERDARREHESATADPARTVQPTDQSNVAG